MRKLLWPCLTFALLLAALILAPLSGAKKNGQSSRDLQAGKMAAQQKSSGPRSFKAVSFGVSPTVRELAQAQRTVEDPSQVFNHLDEVIRSDLADCVGRNKALTGQSSGVRE